MIKIGLTGSIGSGKSTVARKAAEELGIAVFDADRAVHELYADDAELQAFLVRKCGPDVVCDGQVDRQKLGAFMRAPGGQEAWREIEAEVHRRVWEKCDEFFRAQEAAGAKFAIADTPLLFEAGSESRFDYTINVSLPYEVQKQRALARETPKLTEEEFERRYNAFMSPEERNRRADFVIDNSGEADASLLQLRAHIAKMRDPAAPKTLTQSFNEAAVYVGSFDPMTLGHVDVVKSASKMPYKKIYVAIGINPGKNPMFTTEERLAMIEREMDRDVRPYLAEGQEIIVTAYHGLTVDFMKSVGASLCIRGLRGIKDLEEESALAAVNRGLYDGDDFAQAYFATSKPELQHVSSSYARDLCLAGRDLALLQYVSPDVAAKMIAKRNGKSAQPKP
jgi:pantetheine-phosphate adenylyltransferase/dephospho-CoA kinase